MRWLRALLQTPPRPDAARVLAEACAVETGLARRLADDAERLGRYPWLRTEVRALAGEIEAEATRLAAALQRRGRAAPPAPPPAPAARTVWERLRADLDDLRAAAARHADAAYDVERADPEASRLLLDLARRTRAADRRLTWLLARVEPTGLDRPDGAVAEPPEAEPDLAPVAGHLDIDALPTPGSGA